MIRIIMADDHPVVRRGLKEIITEGLPSARVTEVSDGLELMRRIRESDYDIVILDLSMPGADGLDTLGKLKREKPGLRVLVLTIHPERRYAVQCLKLGADGYLTKDTAPDELVLAIKRIAAGRRYISTTLAEQLTEELVGPTGPALHTALTDREYQVFVLIASGERIKDIADKLHLSAKTVSTYRSRILEKLRCRNTADIIRYAMENKLVE
ncbi:two component transcriptional regulator, LuxR family [Desulfacinum infernum DSM 9756]|uniref:Two component transcriptional regulator, LuxR family n=1 Tax=Desulfacinum infernum DSM 9756 TaxID=1121391 RepID=A0A1M5I091_9BACT|nr:response regulator transcription factor [Desulfacinum infernum]SHG21724.1 two component transcriptional regulator, LuxR family [Desulfacinum infernum DSM 9756]